MEFFPSARLEEHNKPALTSPIRSTTIALKWAMLGGGVWLGSKVWRGRAGRTVTLSSLSSPEPMSIGGDSDKSRSPSPERQDDNDKNDNAVKSENVTSNLTSTLNLTSEVKTDNDNNSLRTKV